MLPVCSVTSSISSKAKGGSHGEMKKHKGRKEEERGRKRGRRGRETETEALSLLGSLGIKLRYTLDQPRRRDTGLLPPGLTESWALEVTLSPSDPGILIASKMPEPAPHQGHREGTTGEKEKPQCLGSYPILGPPASPRGGGRVSNTSFRPCCLPGRTGLFRM